MIPARDFAAQAPGEAGYNVDHVAAIHPVIVDAEHAIIDMRGRKAFALCGFAPSTRKYIPIDDPTWVIVGMNQFYRHIPRADLWFDMHSYWRDGNLEGTDHPRWLASCGIPVVMTQRDAAVPTSVRFPMDDVLTKFGLDYFTSSAAYMVAWAILHIDREVEQCARVKESDAVRDMHSPWEGFQRVQQLYGEYTIGIFGIDLVAGTEYERQKACVEFWIGRAASRGITIGVPPEAALLKQTHRYGYQREPAEAFSISDVDNRRVAIERQLGHAVSMTERLAGALDELAFMRQVFTVRARGGTITDDILATALIPSSFQKVEG